MSSTNNQCFLCGQTQNNIFLSQGNYKIIDCEICGRIQVSNTYLSIEEKHLSEEEKVRLRYYFKTTQNPEKLSLGNYKDIIDSINYPSSLLDKIEFVLMHIYNETSFLGDKVEIDSFKDYPKYFCKDSFELERIINFLDAEGYIDNINRSINSPIELLPAGISYIEKVGKNPKSDQCFVAMWFDDSMKNTWTEAIKPAIKESGYKPLRIDQKEHLNYITDEIIKEIRRSKFIIADLTGSRGGVYYEAGFAFGLGLPVIFTCREDDLNNVHFDVKQKNMIIWQDGKLGEFKEILVNRIGATISS